MNCSFGNPIRGRFNAWILHFTDNTSHKVHGEWKQKIFQDLPDSFVELGPGTGGNFRYYRRGSLLTAIEPNRMMRDRLLKKAEQHGINLDIRELRAEDLDLADQSTDAVVSTEVLCTVDDLNQVLNEVYRILRPGGRFLFLEHVPAPKGTLLRRLQDLNIIRQPWHWFFEGCNLNCETDSALNTAGFSKIELEHYKVKSLLPAPIRYYIAGIATK